MEDLLKSKEIIELELDKVLQQVNLLNNKFHELEKIKEQHDEREEELKNFTKVSFITKMNKQLEEKNHEIERLEKELNKYKNKNDIKLPILKKESILDLKEMKIYRLKDDVKGKLLFDLEQRVF